MADMNNMNKEYRLERMNNYAGTAVNERTYNLTIGLTLLWGVLINIVMATFFTYQILSLNYILVIVLYFAGTLGCSYLVHRSDSPAVSFAGFTGMAISMGLLLTFYVTAFRMHPRGICRKYPLPHSAGLHRLHRCPDLLRLHRTGLEQSPAVSQDPRQRDRQRCGHLPGRREPVRQDPVDHRKAQRLILDLLY